MPLSHSRNADREDDKYFFLWIDLSFLIKFPIIWVYKKVFGSLVNCVSIKHQVFLNIISFDILGKCEKFKEVTSIAPNVNELLLIRFLSFVYSYGNTLEKLLFLIRVGVYFEKSIQTFLWKDDEFCPFKLRLIVLLSLFHQNPELLEVILRLWKFLKCYLELRSEQFARIDEILIQ